MRRIMKSFILTASCLIFLCCILSACNDNTEISNYSTPEEDTNNPQNIISNPDSSEYHFDDTFISRTLSSGLKVNANICLSNAVDLETLSIYDAQLVIHDFEEAQQILLDNKQIIEEVATETKESLTNSAYQYCTTDDGFRLSSMGENLYLSGDLQYKISSIIDTEKGGNSELFLTGENLDFASIEQVQKEIESLLQELNIITGTNSVYSINYKTLSIESEKYNEDLERWLDEFISGDISASSRILPKPIIIDDDDQCYLIIYQTTADGMPISTHMNGVFGDGSWTSGTSITCVYSADGIVGLHIPYILEVVEQSAQEEKGMDIEQALEKLDQKYNSFILEGEYLVDNIEFEYIPVPDHGDGDSYTLVPAWRFSILHTYEIADKTDANKIVPVERRTTAVFHAITGTELLMDSGNA